MFASENEKNADDRYHYRYRYRAASEVPTRQESEKQMKSAPMQIDMQPPRCMCKKKANAIADYFGIVLLQASLFEFVSHHTKQKVDPSTHFGGNYLDAAATPRREGPEMRTMAISST